MWQEWSIVAQICTPRGYTLIRVRVYVTLPIAAEPFPDARVQVHIALLERNSSASQTDSLDNGVLPQLQKFAVLYANQIHERPVRVG